MRERINNTYIREGLKMEETEEQMEECRLTQSGYVRRMDEHSIQKNYWK